MRVRWIAAALTLALCFSLAACGHPPVSEEQEEDLTILRIGSDDYEPYSYLDETGDFTGIDVDLAREACRRLGYRPEFHQVVWENKDQELAAGNIDCLWGSFTMTGREDLYQWAGPYLYSRQVVLVQADSDITTLADLAGKRVAVQATSKPETVFLERPEPERVPEVGGVLRHPQRLCRCHRRPRGGHADVYGGFSGILADPGPEPHGFGPGGCVSQGHQRELVGPADYRVAGDAERRNNESDR